VRPESHGTKEPPSSRHSKVAGSLAEKVNVALVLVVVADGQVARVVSGGVVPAGAGVEVGAVVAVAVGTSSIIQVYSKGDGSVLPAASTACTSKLCEPGFRPTTWCGEAQSANGASSREHSNSSSDTSASSSSPVKLKLAELSVLGLGGIPPNVKRVSGGVVSGGVAVGGTGV
jgi:hypothetical protein